MENKLVCDRKTLRSFGFLVGGVFLIIGIWPVFWGESYKILFIGLAFSLIILATVYTNLLYWPYRVWMAVGLVLGWINVRIILGVFFLIIIIPMSMIVRAFKYDPLKRSFDNSINSYGQNVNKRKLTHVEQQF